MSVSKISRIFFLVTAFEMMSFSISLTGDNVCSRIENYTVTLYEIYHEPVVVNTFTWCLQIPPRCLKTRTELRQRHRVKTEQKSRTVKECCEGYKIQIHDDPEMNATCIPICEKCLAGTCVAPNTCQCDPGYYDDNCSLECPPGFWGIQCMEVCDCDERYDCDRVNGTCHCSPGLQGPQCKEHCAIGRWGSGCVNKCTCQNQNNDCDAVTGRCTDDDASSVQQTSSVYLLSSTTERMQTPGISNTEYTDVSSEPRDVTEHQAKDNSDNRYDTNYIPETTSPATASIAVPRATTNEMRIRDPPMITQIVSVSVPERRRDVERDKFVIKDAFLRHVQNDEGVGVPKLDYVKTVRKDDIQTPASIPLDVTLIVVATIVSLGLTSLAVVMFLHMRSKLLETVHLAIYDDEKNKGQECEGANGKRMSAVMSASLPPPPIRANPIYTNAESDTILTVDGIESLNTYANGSATIGLRISGNLRDLLDGHYDRPSATLIRLQPNFDHNTEHLYDEIPSQTTPLSNRKDL
ncbi:uncharacterized protein LOC109860355 isoform X2 [Pseudomyrmex gracilis]|uniref:uncharacterized protein LOC109860355 isoform X2 n=1 Tax=Pseudomyrmex gracilis TaxID=219809 RepID=UPI000995314B|nr:uncharacterized protein LOC109860355 isoform X2 [Pseudomyrmex gracilis]